MNVIGECFDMNWTGALYSPTFTASTHFIVSGSLTAIANMTWATAAFFMVGTGNHTVTSNGVTFSTGGDLIYLYGTGTFTLQDELTASVGIGYGIGATLITNGQTVNVPMFVRGNGAIPTLNLGSSIVNITTVLGTGAILWDAGDAVVDAGTSIIKVNGTAGFAGGGKTYNEVQLNGTAHAISGSNTFSSLIALSSVTQTISLTAGITVTCTTATLDGDATHQHTVQSTTAGTPATIRTTNITDTYVTYTDILLVTRYEYYNTGDDNTGNWVTGATWRAQTFTPATAHTITSVKLFAWRDGSPGTWTVSIRAVDGSEHPTGSDLCSGTTNGDTLTTLTTGEWREITLGAGYALSPSTKYAIVWRCSGAGYVYVRRDVTSPTYAGGNIENSTDSGSTWSTDTTREFMFEEWGNPTDPDIANSPTSYAFGTLVTSAIISTGLDYFTITNNSGFPVDIAISGTDMTGGVAWDLADDGIPGADIYAMKAGLEGGSYNLVFPLAFPIDFDGELVIVKESAPYNTLKSNLADGATQKFGLELLAPTSFSDGVVKSGTVTITAVAS